MSARWGCVMVRTFSGVLVTASLLGGRCLP